MNAGPTSRRTADPPWISFADGLSAMLFVFMLTTVWAMGKMKTKTEQVIESVPSPANTEKMVQVELVALRDCLSTTNTGEVYPDLENHSLAIQVAPLWFGACSTDVSEAGLRAVQAMRSCVWKTIQDEKLADGTRVVDRYDLELVFEGHTDANNVGKGCPYPSNWELSGARAAAVLRRFRCDNGVFCDENEAQVASAISKEVGTVGEDRLRFSAVGMADTRPNWVSICERVGDPLCPAGGGRFPLKGPELINWANLVNGRAAPERQSLLRRVDLRLDLRPRFDRLALVEIRRMP